MPYKYNNLKNIDIEALRECLITQLEAAYFGGIDPPAAAIADVRM